MKVITIKQPWASLIANGYKVYEFRTWNTKYRGDILIHAGKGIDKKSMDLFKDYGIDFPLGCIIAKAKLTDSVIVDKKFVDEIVPTEPLVYKRFKDNPDWVGYGFKLENVERIKPIYINGKLSLWNYNYEGE